ncbi:hypothetical protein [Corynebacterium sp. CCM 9204]|uniref:hypothetical protein n=1 Tax=Corynebacterium sp. CCM 9204 TaxID=3057616 RepID=UPI003525FCF7
MTETSNLDELIAAERAKANARIAKLRKQAAAEQRKVDTKVVELLKEHHRVSYEELVEQARAVLDAEKAERSRKAKASTAAISAEPASEVGNSSEKSDEVGQSWNG